VFCPSPDSCLAPTTLAYLTSGLASKVTGVYVGSGNENVMERVGVCSDSHNYFTISICLVPGFIVYHPLINQGHARYPCKESYRLSLVELT